MLGIVVLAHLILNMLGIDLVALLIVGYYPHRLFHQLRGLTQCPDLFNNGVQVIC